MFKWDFDIWDPVVKSILKNNTTSNTTFITKQIFFTLNLETYLRLYIFCATILHKQNSTPTCRTRILFLN